MSEKFVIRFSPQDTSGFLTSVSFSAIEKYGEVISVGALPLSESLKEELELLEENIRRLPSDSVSKAVYREDMLKLYNTAQQLCIKLETELSGDFEIISTIEKLHPDHKKSCAKCVIRPLPPKGYPLLDRFLYDAIFIPEGVEPPPFEIVKNPDLQVYVESFGTRKGDIALAAVLNDKIVGVAWARIMNDYGHVDDDTPSIAISVVKSCRGMGIGMQLMANLLINLCGMGFRQVSLAVQRENHTAVKLYVKLGFRVLSIKGDEYIMLFDLTKIHE